MDYIVQLYLLSTKFLQDYPTSLYPEIMYKQERPYACLAIETNDDYYICIPFRSSIKHTNAYFFKTSNRSIKTRSGLDYSKIVLINNPEYFDEINPVIVDQDEYREVTDNLPRIVDEAITYVHDYINHINGITPLSSRQFERKYGYSTLVYFHALLGLGT